MDIRELAEIYQHWDIKAEVAAADLVGTGVPLENITVRPQGVFSRKFRKDILRMLKDDSQSAELQINDPEDQIFIDVSRDGIFDSLPQGLFYLPERGKASKTLENKIEQLKKQREEETENRKFLSVFEKEFYACRVLVELEERKSVIGISENFNTDLYAEIWPELDGLNKTFHKYLLQILPLAHKCRGNTAMSEMLLGIVLNELVEIRVDHNPRICKNQFAANQLGKRYLGTDFILGDYTPAYEARYFINIGPVLRKNLKKYLFNGDNYKVIVFLLDYFIPVEADFEINILVERAAENLFLRDSDNYCFLGYDTKI